MRDPEKFDVFYQDARERLLAQTFALTGDLAASRRAVRDAFVVVRTMQSALAPARGAPS